MMSPLLAFVLGMLIGVLLLLCCLLLCKMELLFWIICLGE